MGAEESSGNAPPLSAPWSLISWMPDVAIERAEDAAARGSDAEAERTLREELRRAGNVGDVAGEVAARIGLASLSLWVDDERRATAMLHALGDEPIAHVETCARAWVVRSRLARRRGGPTPVRLDVDVDAVAPDLTVTLLLEQAAGERLAQHRADAMELIERAAARAPVGTVSAARVDAARAELALSTGDPVTAGVALRAAISMFAELGYPREEGRALLRYAEAIAPHVSGEAPAAWLGRARSALGTCATFRDRAALRSGFRVHGRRLPDAVLVESVAARVDVLEQASASLRSAIATASDAIDLALARAARGVPTASAVLEAARATAVDLVSEATPLVGDVERAGSDLAEFMGAALVERDRMRGLLRALAELDGVFELGAYARAAAALATRVLDADRVVVASAPREGEVREVGSHAARGGIAAELWKPAVEAVRRFPDSAPPDGPAPSLRVDAKPRGPVLVVPIRSSTFQGAVYADKLVRAGQFRDADHHLAALLAEYLAQGFGRILAREAEHLALAQLGATLDAIRDGVVAMDRDGVVQHVNAAAARMLRVSEGGFAGRKLDAFDHLVPLAETLAGKERPDGQVVRLAHGSIVVTARAIGATADDTTGRGTVATLVELDRAQRMALRITGTRPRYGFHDVIGDSSAIAEALRMCRQASTVDANVLITGESGTGKEVLAQAIHTGSARAGEPFVGINCAALPRELLEAELFGHERGAFTGARAEGAVGKFEQAGEGTLLLDEIGDMPLDMQVKLLRVLQERVVVRLGGTRERPVLARIIATTHRALDEAVERGTFRLDLLYRLRVLHVHLPPLRERRGDVELLALHFLKRVAEGQSKRVTRMSGDVLGQLQVYSWPGNVRELANVIEREVSLLPATATSLDRFEVPLGGPSRIDVFAGETPTMSRMRAVSASAGAATMPTEIIPLADVEKRAYLDAYAACGSNVPRAAKALGVSKVTFYAKLRQWGMHPADEPGPETMRRIRIVEEERIPDTKRGRTE
jgi:transcriptional regulator with PAS, ATPase and Fis domain